MKKILLLSMAFILLTACARNAPNSSPSIVPPSSPIGLPSALPLPTQPSVPTTAPTTALPSDTRQLTLTLVGEPRALPSKILGASAEPLIEHLIDDPRKVAAIKATAPAVIRFPGGSQSNYYNWRDGLLHFDPKPNSSAYYKFWSDIAPRIARAMPNGVTHEQYAQFAAEVGADTLLVPNLETSTVDDQVAWFKKLASEKILPRDIELGNEFWIAMAGDPSVMRVWQNERSSMDVMHRYEQALRPVVGAGAKFAVQASGATFDYAPTDRRPFIQRLLQWDQDLAPADWFEAVTAHLYPDPDTIAAQAGNPKPDVLFPLFMARADAGIDHALTEIEKHVPGKEIWVTEWSPRGGAPPLDPNHVDKATPPMMAHLVARTTLTILRHPSVTKSLFFTLNATDNSPFQMYVQSGGKYVPMPATVILGWFDDAANEGSSFQRVIDASDTPITGLGTFSESYRPIEGGLFKSTKRTVLILQNTSAQARRYDPAQTSQPKPSRVELLVASDIGNAVHTPAQITTIDPANPIVLPPFSLARIVWE